jgi:thioredoxin reductase
MDTRYDYLILGAGAAGLQMAYCLEKAGHSYLVLEAGVGPGTFFTQYPRHRKLISINKVHTGFDDREKNLRWDWNSLLCDDEQMQFKHYSKRYWPAADDLVRYLSDFASHHGLNVRYGTEAARIERSGQGFRVSDDAGNTYAGTRLIVATGVRKPYIPAIPGIEHCENYTDVNVDPDTFINQRVLILGKGNSAFEMAELLTETTAMIHVCSPNPIKMAWATHHVGHLRAVNNNFLDTYQLKTQNGVLDAQVKRVERRDGQLVATLAYAHADGEVEEIAYDRIIVCTGFRMDTDPFAANVRPQLCIQDRFPALTSSWESVNVPGMYFAGTLMQSRDFKKTSSGFIHGFRYNVRALFQLLERRHHGRALPTRQIAPTASACTQAVLAVVNRSSAVWQQFGFLGDFIQAAGDGSLSHIAAMPVDHIHDTLAERERDYFIVTLEYGSHKAREPFQIQRPDSRDADRAAQSSFLHPVVRHCRDGQVLAEQHLMEHLETDWTQPHHIEPLLAFFQRTLPVAIGATGVTSEALATA